MSHDPSPPTSMMEIPASAVMGDPQRVPRTPPVTMAAPRRVPETPVPQTPPVTARRGDFTITSPEGACACRDVSGFREAVAAAQDPRAPTPLRLSLVSPDEEAAAWLERWSEDVEQVRRRVTVRRADGIEITVVATLASYGDGIPTSLAVESIRPLQGGAILRSGVHPRAEVEAAIAHYEASGGGAPAWGPPQNPVHTGPADVP